MVAAATAAKSIPASPLEAEEWSGGPYCVVRYATRLMRTLDEIAEHGTPSVRPKAVRTRPGGQLVVRVFPDTRADQILFRGFQGEIWIQRGVKRENLPENMACFYRQIKPAGKISVVLGAGNVASIAPLAVLSKPTRRGTSAS
jgi:hypothetical protein